MWNDLLAELLISCFCYVSGVPISMISFRSSLMNCDLKTTEFLAIDFNSDGYNTRRQFIAEDGFVPLNGQHLRRMSTSFFC